ncbi:hypothetical protein N7492_009469 [Penicillium capsulatum]|uniref:Uncharacterized protein n=1 Tax=Penicillium capsulatum TaxID=69766 RepID=A0A9W9HVD2_9EURO|nr:hypothetical protein N7492_009469 [Penicillium capsulatum]KAJ6106859.1 hypothetical protein N7512_010376 [Penicillium capsulatum]
MAGIVNKPLGIFRRSDSPKPLHSRWGDVDITVPTDGSWNQYNNPHRRASRTQTYGPGFVPDGPSTRTARPAKERSEESSKGGLNHTTSLSRHSSLSLGSSRPGRLSVRLASRPQQLQDEEPIERSHRSEQTTSGYAYKPIQQNYTAEVTEKSHRAHGPQYRYIPTSGRYLEGTPVSPRSQSARSHRSSRDRRDSFSDYLDSDERRQDVRPSYEGSSRRDSEEDRRSLRSSVGDSSDNSSPRFSYGLPPRRRTSPCVAADRKRASSLKPMTLAMVPDPEELYN